LTLDEQRKEAVQHWLKYREEQQRVPSKEQGRGIEQEHKVPKGSDGQEHE